MVQTLFYWQLLIFADICSYLLIFADICWYLPQNPGNSNCDMDLDTISLCEAPNTVSLFLVASSVFQWSSSFLFFLLLWWSRWVCVIIRPNTPSECRTRFTETIRHYYLLVVKSLLVVQVTINKLVMIDILSILVTQTVISLIQLITSRGTELEERVKVKKTLCFHNWYKPMIDATKVLVTAGCDTI